MYDALRRVSLEHVPQILATGRWEDRAFEVAEELTGGTLADLGIVSGDVAGIRRIVYELGKALDALAEVGLRHRDIRPGTLLVAKPRPRRLGHWRLWFCATFRVRPRHRLPAGGYSLHRPRGGRGRRRSGLRLVEPGHRGA